MKAIRMHAYGDPDVLRFEDVKCVEHILTFKNPSGGDVRGLPMGDY